MNAKRRGKKRRFAGWVLVITATAMAIGLWCAPIYGGFVEYASGTRRWQLMANDRSVTAARVDLAPTRPPNPTLHVMLIDTDVKVPQWSSCWESPLSAAVHLRNVEIERVYSKMGGTVLRLNAWAVPGVIAMSGGLLLLWSWRAARRIGEGCCLRCGYDRRGLGAEAKCPECGEVRGG